MKIAVFELDYHFSDLMSFCGVSQKSSHELTVFISQSLFKRVTNQDYLNKFIWIVKPESQSIAKLLEENKVLLNNQDVIFFATIASGYQDFFNFEFKAKTVLRIHNANTYLNPWKNIHFEFSMFYLRKAAYYIFNDVIRQKSLYYIPKIVKKVDYITFPDKSIEKYVAATGLLEMRKIFPSIPIGYPEFEFGIKLKEISELNITIIGLIDERKRDYLFVLEAFKILVPQLKSKIKLTILGRPVGEYGNKIITLFNHTFTSDFIKIQTFDKFIPQEAFEEEIQKTNLILAPIKPQLVFGIFNEYCGKTKTTGSLADMIRLGVPLILPEEVNIDTELNSFAATYTSPNNLAEIILNYMKYPNSPLERTRKLRLFLQDKYSANVDNDGFVKLFFLEA